MAYSSTTSFPLQTISVYPKQKTATVDNDGLTVLANSTPTSILGDVQPVSTRSQNMLEQLAEAQRGKETKIIYCDQSATLVQGAEVGLANGTRWLIGVVEDWPDDPDAPTAVLVTRVS